MLRELPPPAKGSCHDVTLAPDGRTALSADGSVLRLWSIPDGKQLASTCGRRVVLWDAAGHNQMITEWEHSVAVNDLAFADDSRHLAVAHADGTIYVYRLRAP